MCHKSMALECSNIFMSPLHLKLHISLPKFHLVVEDKPEVMVKAEVVVIFKAVLKVLLKALLEEVFICFR